jgi:hypothetical protein
LRSAPDCRTRRALLHLSYSYATPFGPAVLVTQDQFEELYRMHVADRDRLEQELDEISK